MRSTVDFEPTRDDEAEPAPRLAVAFLVMILFITLLALVAPDAPVDQDVGQNNGSNAVHAVTDNAS
ncbi:MAG TPA: hypothetical protein VGG27_18710 [Magnetospirillaceae bacterium]